MSPLFSASKGLFGSKVLVPPGSPSMPQGGPFLGSPGAESLRTGGAPSCAANMPACGIFCGALCGPRLPLDGISGGSGGGASSPRLCMPSLRASRGGIPSTPVSFRGGSGSGLHSLWDEPSRGGGGGASSPRLHVPIEGASRGDVLDSPESFCDGGSGGVPSPRHASLFAQGSNTLGCVAVAFTAPPASSTLGVPSVRASVPFVSNDAPLGSCASMTTRSTTSAPTFSATLLRSRLGAR
jgi:hypothetical protein